MGLLDVINGMQNGPRGAPQPGSSSGGGMSPITMAILGVLAYKAVKHFTAPGATESSSSVAPGNADSSSLGPLGSLFGGGLSGGMLSSGLSNLVKDLHGSGSGEAAQSWIGGGSNQPIAPSRLEAALGGDTVDALAQQTGMDRDSLLNELSQHLPGVVDHLTPNGRLPTAEEVARMS
jgi:uncharacterized protein YidB (DUF937 family)